MINMTVTYQSERLALLKRIFAKERRTLYRVGGYGRKVMRTMIKRRKSVSPPGQPPHAHAPGGSGMKRTYFEVYPNQLNVLMGHKKHDGRARFTNGGGAVMVSSPCPVPQLLNEGGPAALLVSTSGGRQYFVPHIYRARPFRDKAERAIYDFALKTLAKEVL